MAAIPHALDNDAEDVAWALQTAEALWKRNERIDAIVWLRRAAQAAGEADDDDRALTLARDAAELAEWIAQNPAPDAVRSAPPPTDAATTGEAVDSLLRHSNTGIDIPIESAPMMSEESPRPPDPPSPRPPRARASPQPLPPPLPPTWPPPAEAPPPMRALLDTATQETPVPSDVLRAAASVPPAPQSEPSIRTSPRISSPPELAARVPSAAEAHAGMLDPWADDLPPKQRARRRAVPPPIPVAAPPAAAPARPTPPAPRPSPPPLPAVAAATATLPDPPPPQAPAPSPAHALAPTPASNFETEEVVTSAPPLGRPKLAQSAPPKPPRAKSPRPPPVPLPPMRARMLSKPVAPPTTGVDLTSVDTLSDLPDDARGAFAKAATVHELALDEEIAGFALALVLEGGVDVSATIVDAPALRLVAGSVLRARGTIDHAAPLRLLGAEARSRVATWDERDVSEAFRTCPWVEDELRAAGDRYQALVGATMGPLGERLDAELRASVTGRLTIKALAEHEVFAVRGKPIPGLLVVGAGELELVDDDGQPASETLHAGEFLFPGEVLRAAPAPSTARAAKGGALILFAERGVAQELLVTCPPLLEIFAG
jgi:hypothetical protein